MPRSARTDINGTELVFNPSDIFGQMAHHAQQTVRAVTEVEMIVLAQKDIPSIAEKLNSDVGEWCSRACWPQHCQGHALRWHTMHT